MAASGEEEFLLRMLHIQPGTLFVQSKAIACIFDDEIERSADFMSSLNPSLRNSAYRPMLLALVDKLYSAVTINECGRAILNLEGGRSVGLDTQLMRDDVYKTTVPEITPMEMLDITLVNGFEVSERTQAGERVKGLKCRMLPETKLLAPQIFPSDTPRQFALAWLLNIIIPRLYLTLQEQRSL